MRNTLGNTKAGLMLVIGMTAFATILWLFEFPLGAYYIPVFGFLEGLHLLFKGYRAEK